MAGPGIRYFHLARVLARHLPTTLAIPDDTRSDLEPSEFTLVRYNSQQWSSLEAHVHAATICFFPSDIASTFPELGETSAHLVIDGYDPLLIEWLSLMGNLPIGEQLARWHKRTLDLAVQFRIGDFFVCASERQRDWWLGMLEAHRRINPATIAADPSLRNLIDTLPYGLRSDRLPPHRPVVKGVWKGIAANDHLILWGGGLWTWLDPLTAIRAVAQIWQQRQDVKLIFPGSKHPNPNLANIPTHAEAAQRLASELGILDKAVFFGQWLPYEDWPHVLQESSIALSLHFETLETRLAFRSRVLEYIWAGVPIVSTSGDATSELIAKYNLGIIVEPNDVDGVVAAIHHLLGNRGTQSTQSSLAQARQALAWETTASSLIRYCQQPWHAADKVLGEKDATLSIFGKPSEIGSEANAALRLERDYWRSLAQAYERGRVIKAINWVKRRLLRR